MKNNFNFILRIDLMVTYQAGITSFLNGTLIASKILRIPHVRYIK